ncbi:hypothetical protein RYX36_000674 [Vicia faba]
MDGVRMCGDGERGGDAFAATGEEKSITDILKRSEDANNMDLDLYGLDWIGKKENGESDSDSDSYSKLNSNFGCCNFTLSGG